MMDRRHQESCWRRMDVDCPKSGWLVLFGGGLPSAVDGSRLKTRQGKIYTASHLVSIVLYCVIISHSSRITILQKLNLTTGVHLTV